MAKVLRAVVVIHFGVSSLGVLGLLVEPDTSSRITGLIVAAWAVSLLIALGVFVFPPLYRAVNRVLALMAHVPLLPYLIFFALLLPIFPLLRLIYYAQVPPLWSYVPFVLLWPPLTIALLMLHSDVLRARTGVWVGRFALMIASVLFTLALIEGALQFALRADLLPITLTVRMPDIEEIRPVNYETESGIPERRPGPETIEVDEAFLEYSVCPGVTVPETPYTVRFTRDEHGFRNPTPWPDAVDLVTLGDSFTDAFLLHKPFVEDLGVSTLNLGLAGSGNLAQLIYLRTYGLPRSPEVVVLFYYEGNDMHDNFLEEQAFTNTERTVKNLPFWRYSVTVQLILALINRANPPPLDPCVPPVEDRYGNRFMFRTTSLALYTYDREWLEDSLYFEVTRDTLTTMAREVREAGATFIVGYIPDRLQVHWPGLVGTQAEAAISEMAFQYDINNPDLPIKARGSVLAQTIRENIRTQRDLIAQIAVEEDFLFLDFTPIFQQAAAEGQNLYFFADLHWNEHGNQLAHCVLADFLAENTELNVMRCAS